MRELSQPPETKPQKIIKIFAQPFPKALSEYLAKINTDYLHWEDVKHRTPPGELKVEDAWGVVKLLRFAASKPLPIKDENGRPFFYWIPDSTQEVLHEIDQNSSGSLAFNSSDEGDQTSTVTNRFLVSSLIDEAIATSKIEGAITTWVEAEKMLREQRRPRDKSEQMILNSYNTIQKLRQRVDEPLSLELLHEIQTLITEKTLENPEHAGRFRQSHEKITVVENSTGDVVYTPPDATHLHERMQKLIEFANSPSTGTQFIHPFVKACILHFWLAYEHPYCDGNGRTARSLIFWYLIKNKYWLFQYLPLSKFVIEAPAQYYRSFLYTEKDGNDLTYSIVYMAKVARKAIEALHKNISELKKEQKGLADSLKRYSGINHRQRELLRELLKDDTTMVSIKYHQNLHQVTYETARTDILELVKLGFLDQVSSGKKFLFTTTNRFHDLLASSTRKGKLKKKS
jgi:Fic family protein